MRDFLTEYDIANTVRMAATHHKGSFLLVEGDTDARIYEAFIETTECQVIVAYNKSNAIGALGLLEAEGRVGCLAIVDADFLFLEAKEPRSANIIITDTHDLETLILRTPALEKVLRELASKRKLNQFTRNQGQSIRDILLREGMVIGYLRWISEKDNLFLKFQGIDFREFTDIDTVMIDEIKLINTIKGNSNKPGLFIPGVQQRIIKLRNTNHDPWHVCCGHDLMGLMSIGLQKAIGSRSSGEVSREILERHFRLAFEYEFFRETKLFIEIRAWESRNKPYKILRNYQI